MVFWKVNVEEHDVVIGIRMWNKIEALGGVQVNL